MSRMLTKMILAAVYPMGKRSPGNDNFAHYTKYVSPRVADDTMPT